LLSTVVRRIAWSRGAVAVEASAPTGAVTIRARALIVTLPIGVLRNAGDETAVRFEPVLPAAARDALDFIEMGPVVKIVLRFATPFWERVRDGRYRDAGFFRSSEGPFPGFWTQYPIGGNIIAAWAGGPRAAALGGATEGELAHSALEEFGTILGAPDLARSEFTSAAMHDWNRDPFARGAYSYVRVGGANARATLALPVDDTLFFAGEATSTDGQGGTVNGALQTGARAARGAAAALGAAVRHA
jgi:monoamine oxidase